MIWLEGNDWKCIFTTHGIKDEDGDADSLLMLLPFIISYSTPKGKLGRKGWLLYSNHIVDVYCIANDCKYAIASDAIMGKYDNLDANTK